MKILVYGLNFAPEMTGVGKYTSEMVLDLKNAGHEVRVVTAPPYYPSWKVFPGFSSHKYVKEIWNDIEVWRVPLWVPSTVSGKKRLLHLASFAISSLPAVFRHIFWRPDIVWMVEPSLASLPNGLFFAKCCSARTWLHVQDFEVDAAFGLGIVKGRKARSFIEKLELFLMRRFDVVSTISAAMIKLAIKKGVPFDKTYFFPNWVDVSHIAPLSNPSIYREKLGIPDDKVVALYSGNMGDKQGLEILGEVAKILKNSEVFFVFCGEGSGRVRMQQACEGLANVLFLDLQPFDLLGELLGLADIHLLPQRADAADLVMPSKLTGMAASGRPVIVTAHRGTELAEVVANFGLIVEPGNAEQLADAILYLANSVGERSKLGLAARRYAEENLSRAKILERFRDRLTSVV